MPSKRNPLKDIPSDAQRVRDLREKETKAERKLRSALGNPKDPAGRELPEHAVKSIAANRLQGVTGTSSASTFEHAISIYFRGLQPRPGRKVPIHDFWTQFLEMVEAAVPDLCALFATNYETHFHWGLVGYMYHLQAAYDAKPEATKSVMIVELLRVRRFVGVMNDGRLFEMAADNLPDSPAVIFAGQQIGRFQVEGVNDSRVIFERREMETILRGTRPPHSDRASLQTVHEDSLINVGFCEGDDALSIQDELTRTLRTHAEISARRHKGIA